MDGHRLKFAREKAGHTQESLAEQLMIHKKNLTLYENGKSEPSADVLSRIASVLGVSADYLLGLTDDPAPANQRDGLSPIERKVVAALRRREPYEAIRTIVGDDKLASAT